LPDRDVPVLSWIEPDNPALPTFDDASVTDPDPELELEPVLTVKDPPSAEAVVAPAWMTTLPPAALEPWPTVILIEPPDPPVAVPDSSAM